MESSCMRAPCRRISLSFTMPQSLVTGRVVGKPEVMPIVDEKVFLSSYDSASSQVGPMPIRFDAIVIGAGQAGPVDAGDRDFQNQARPIGIGDQQVAAATKDEQRQIAGASEDNLQCETSIGYLVHQLGAGVIRPNTINPQMELWFMRLWRWNHQVSRPSSPDQPGTALASFPWPGCGEP